MAIEKRIGAYSAYAIAVENGFQGTVDEWLESLIGPRGYQGWGVSAVNVSADGSLIFTIKNPETGETRELEPIQIETLNALNSISTAKDEAVNEVKEAQTQATEAVGTAGNQTLQDISNAKTSAMSDINTTGKNAVNSVNSAGQTAVENAQTAITTTKNQAISDVQNAGQSAVEAVGTAQTNAVQAVQNAGTEEAEKISDILPVPTAEDAGKVPVAKPDGTGYELGTAEGGGAIDDENTSTETTWSSQNIVSRICPPFEVSGSFVSCQPIEGSVLNIISDSIDTSTIFIAGKNLFSGVKGTAGSNTYFAQYNSNVFLRPDTTYTLSLNIQGAKEPFAVSVGVGDNAIPYRMDISRVDGVNNGSFKMTFKTPSAMTYHLMSIRAPRYTEAQSEMSGELSEIQLEYSDNASPFEEYKGGSVEYNGESISIPVLSGTNTIFADAGNVTVSGYSDPTTIIKNLADRIAALEQNAIGG